MHNSCHYKALQNLVLIFSKTICFKAEKLKQIISQDFFQMF